MSIKKELSILPNLWHLLDMTGEIYLLITSMVIGILDDEEEYGVIHVTPQDGYSYDYKVSLENFYKIQAMIDEVLYHD